MVSQAQMALWAHGVDHGIVVNIGQSQTIALPVVRGGMCRLWDPNVATFLRETRLSGWLRCYGNLLFSFGELFSEHWSYESAQCVDSCLLMMR